MNELQNRLVKFSVNVSNLTDGFYNQPALKSIVNQLNRATSSIGANYSEAQSASSRKDFHNKVRIALKEARESEYWLQIMVEKLKGKKDFNLLLGEAVIIIKILTVIARKTDPDKTHI
ncbi:MAG: four helix bundle protein [Bacteroidota bacterium]|nr:four helix bundle protein [Bacteroidota bacterium]